MVLYKPTLTAPGNGTTDVANVSANIPAITDIANVVAAFQNYHDNVGYLINLKAPIASPTFTGTVTTSIISATGNITTTANVVGNLIGNVNAISTSNGKVTLENTSSNVYGPKGRIFVQSTQPVNPQTGDLWMW